MYEVNKAMSFRGKIAFAGPSITDVEVEIVRDAVINGFYANFDGYIRKFEQKMRDILGVKHCIATHSCTLALYTACLALDLGPGDEVICTDCSWASTSFVIDYTGATPVFVDIEPETWCISPEAIEKAITKKTKAIMLVHMWGHPARMDAIMEIATRHHLRVIEDAAPALGASFHGRKVGTFGDFGCFSFHGAKLAVSGEGGALVTNDSELYERALMLVNMGRTDSKAVFWCDFLGRQHTPANLASALAYAQLTRLDELIAMKRRISAWYVERLRGVEGIGWLEEQPDCFSTMCYPAFLTGENIKVPRVDILARLRELDIHGRPAFPRMSRFPMHVQRYPNPVATLVEERGMNLPAAMNLTEDDVDLVCSSLLDIIR